MLTPKFWLSTPNSPFAYTLAGSPSGHSPVLNLSKSGGLDQGSTGDQSERSEGGQSPAPSLIRDEEEHDLSDDNVSEVDDREEKDEGTCVRTGHDVLMNIDGGIGAQT